MSRNVSSTTRQAFYAEQTGYLFLVLVEISHADLTNPIRLVNNYESIVHNGDTYDAFAFNFTPPVEVDGEIKNAEISFDNVTRQVVEAIRSITSPPDVTAKLIRADAPDTVEAGPWEFKLRNVTYQRQEVSGELVPDGPLRLNISTISYSNLTFPGLYG
jgi:hypothetical protein